MKGKVKILKTIYNKKIQDITINILNQISVDGICTPNFTRESNNSSDFCLDTANILPLDANKKRSIHAGLDGMDTSDGVQKGYKQPSFIPGSNL